MFLSLELYNVAAVNFQWYPEIAYYCPCVPIILVGTKMDIREAAKNKQSDNITFFSHSQGVSLANKINAVTYVECSAKTQKGLKAVFDEAVKAVLVPEKPKRNKKKGKFCDLI